MKIAKIFKFIFDNRRMIGLIIGGTLTIAGYPEAGSYVTNVGAV